MLPQTETELESDFHQGLAMLRALKAEFAPTRRRIPSRNLHNMPYQELIDLSKEFLASEHYDLIVAMEIYLKMNQSRLKTSQVTYMLGMYRKSLSVLLEKVQLQTDLAELKERFPTAFRREQ